MASLPTTTTTNYDYQNLLKRSVEVCENYVNQSSDIWKNAKQLLEKNKISLTKLHLCIGEIEKQMNTLKDSNSKFKEKHRSFITDYNTLINQKDSVFKSLDEKLQDLKLKQLDKNITMNLQEKNKNTNNNNNNNNNNNDSELKTTLYDFIDIDSLEILKNQFHSEVDTLENICQNILKLIVSNTNKIVDIDQQCNDIKKMYKVEIDENNKINNEIFKQLINSVDQINNIYIDLCSIYDYNKYYLGQQQQQQNNPTTTHIQQQQQQQPQLPQKQQNRTKEEITKMVSNSYDNIYLLKDNVRLLQERCQKIELIFVKCHQMSNLFTEETDNLSRDWEVFERSNWSFEQHHSVSNYLVGELYSLLRWYEMFDSSYDQLLDEEKRRQKEFFRVKSLAEKYDTKLKSFYSNEQQCRLNFYESFGKYLPVSLFSSISDPQPIQFQVKQIEDIQIEMNLNTIQQQQPPPQQQQQHGNNNNNNNINSQ